MTETTNNLKLRPYQQQAVDYMAVRPYGAILADEPGLGKTVQAIALINRMAPASVLIVSPASLRCNWRTELSRWLAVPSDITVAGYEELVRKNIPLFGPWDMAVFDEAHNLKNLESKRSIYASRIQAPYKLFITGTPILNRPIEAYYMLRELGLQMTEHDFACEYCNARSVNTPAGPRWDYSGSSNLPGLNALLSQVMIRRRKSEVLDELPPKYLQIMEYEAEGVKETEARYVSFKEAAACLETPDIHNIPFRAIRQKLNKARREVSRAKLPAMIQLLENIAANEEKIVVFAKHREIVDAIHRAFPGSVRYWGGMADEDKDLAVRSFQDGAAPMFVGQIDTAREGLTLVAARTAVIVEPDWVPGVLLQAMDRIHRIGQRKPVRVIIPVVTGTVEALMIRKVAQKMEVIQQAVDCANTYGRAAY